MVALSPTSSPVKKLKCRARSHNEAIQLDTNIPLKVVDMSLLEKPVLQPLLQLLCNHYNYSELRLHSLAEFNILPEESEEIKCFKRKVIRYCLYKYLGLNLALLHDFLSTSTVTLYSMCILMY